jgi:hypothetical protein
MSRNKSLEDLNSSDYQMDASLGLSANAKATLEARDASSLCSLNSASRGPSPAQQVQHSMLEKCLRLYEQFYVKLITRRVLETDMSVPSLSEYEVYFGYLRMPSCKESFDERTRHLEKLLKSKLDLDDLNAINKKSSSPSEIAQSGKPTFFFFLHYYYNGY